MDKKTIARYGFISALKDYNNELAERLSLNNLGIYTDSILYNKKSNVSDIVFSNIKENLLITTGATKEKISRAISSRLANNIREIKKGVAVINNKGIYFFVIESTVYNNITSHYFFPLEQLPQIDITIKKKIFFQKPFTIKNIHSDSPNEDYYKTISLDYKHTPNDITFNKLSKLKVLYTIAVIFLVGISFMAIYRTWINPFPYRTYVGAIFTQAVSSPFVQHHYYRRTTTFTARIETEVFRITFVNRNSGYFVGATIHGNLNLFLLELSNEQAVTLAGNDIVRVRAACVGAIRDRRVPHRNNLNSDDEVVRIQAISRTRPYTTLGQATFLHMRVDTIEVLESIDVINIDSNSHSNIPKNYQITFLDAYISAITTSQTALMFGGYRYETSDVLIIDYDFASLLGVAISHENTFRRDFVVYDSNGNRLEFWDYNEFIPDDNFIAIDERRWPGTILSHRNRWLLSTATVTFQS